MEKYVNQLIEDLEKAAEQKIECPDYTLLNPNHPAIDYGLDYIVAWECAPDEQMPDVFGINAAAFPPPERLTEEQALRINQAILKLWEVNHILADLPEKLPSHLILYRELRKKWQEDTIRIMPEGNMHLEFCYYVPDECPWGMDFCTCKDFIGYDDSMDNVEKSKNDDELPF